MAKPAKSPPVKLLLICQKHEESRLCELLESNRYSCEVCTPSEARQIDFANHSSELTLLATNGLSLSDLKFLGSSHRQQNRKCLFLVGDRGLAGCEELISQNNAFVLPDPWTSQGLYASISKLIADPIAIDSPHSLAEIAGSGDYLLGLSESLRDFFGPLAMVEFCTEIPTNVVSQVSHSTAMLELLAEGSILVGGAQNAHPNRLELQSLVSHLNSKLTSMNYSIELGDCAEGYCQADPRFTTAAISFAVIYLTKFGTGGVIQLTITEAADEQHQLHLFQDKTDAIGATKPPTYLSQTATGILQQANMKSSWDTTPHGIPFQFNVSLPATD